MAGTVRELQARFTAVTTGMRQGIRQIQRDMQGIGTSTERAVNQSNRSLNQLDATLQRVEQQIDETGNPDTFKELNRTLKDSQQEFKSTGRIGERSMSAVQDAIEEAKRELASMTAEGIVEMNALEAAIHDVEQELESLGDNSPLGDVNTETRDTTDSMDNLQTSILEARDAFKQLDDSTRVKDDKGRFYSLSFKRLEESLNNVQLEFRETGDVSQETFQTFGREVSKARAALSQLGDADGVAQLTAAIDEAENHMRSFGRNTGLPEFRSEVDSTESAMDRLRGTVMDVTVVGKALKMSLVGLAPAAVPALASVTSGVMGLVSAFGAAAGSIAGFATVAIPTLMDIFKAQEDINKAQEKVDNATTEKQRLAAVEKLKNLQAALSDEQRRALDAINDFTTYFEQLRKSFEKPVFNIFTQGLKTLQTLLEMFKPVIDASVQSVQNLMNSLDRSLQTKDLESFFGFLAMRAGPALEAVAESVGYLIRGVLNLMVAFDSQGKTMERGLVNLTKGFSEWTSTLSKTQGFKDFIAYSNANTPTFLKLLSNLWDILKNITVILAPFGQVMLVILTGLTGFIAKITDVTKAFTQWEGFIPLVYGLATAFATLKASMMISSIAPWIIGLLNPMTRAMVLTQLWTKAQMMLNASMFANPIGLVIALIAGLTVGLIAAYKHSETFRNAVNKTWSTIKNAAISATTVIGDVASKMWDKALEATEAMRDALSNKVKEWGPAITQGFTSAISSIGSFFSNIGSSLAKMFGSGFFDQLKFAFSNLSGAISLVAPALTGLTLSMMGVGGPIALVIGGIVSLIGFLYRLSQTNEDVANFFSSAWQGIKSVFSSVMSALQPIIQVFIDSFREMSKELGPEFKKTGDIIKQSFAGLKPAFSELGKAFGDLAPVIGSTVSQISSAIGGLLPVVVPIITQLIGLWVQVQKTIWGAVFQIVTTLLPMLVNVFKQIFPVILNVVKAVLPVIISLIGSLIPIILQIVQSVLPVLLSIVKAVFPVILSIIKAVLPVVVTLLQTVIGVVLMLVKTILPLILSVVKAVFPVILSIIQGVIPVIVGLLKLVVGVVTTVLVPAIKTILQVVQIVFPAIMKVIQNAITIITNIIKFWAAVLKGDWSGAWKAVLTILKTVWDSIKTVIKAALDIVVAVLKGAWTIIKNVTSSTFNAVKSFLLSVWNAIKSAVSAVINVLVNYVKGQWNALKSMTISVFNAVKSFLTSVWNAIKNTIQKAANDVFNRVKAVWNNIKNITTSVFNAVKNFLVNTWNTIKNTVSKLANSAKDGVVNAWNTLKNRTTEMFNTIKSKVTSIFDDIVGAAKKLPGRIGDGIKAAAGGVKAGIKSFANTMVQAMGKGLNGAIDGINWVLKKVDVPEIKKWTIPKYEKGTGNGKHPGGLAVLGDGGEHELYRTPKGQVGLSPNTDTLMNLPKGTEVLSGKQTKQAFSTAGVPMYDGGSGVIGGIKKGASWVGGKASDAYDSSKKYVSKKAGQVADKGQELYEHAKDETKKAAGKVKDLALDVWDYMDDPVALMKKVFGKFIPDLPKLGSAAGDMLKGGVKKAKDSSIDFIKSKLDSFMSFDGGGGDGSTVGPGSGYGGMHPYVEAWYKKVKDKFGPTKFMGGYNNRNVRGGSSKSMHAYGRAFDIGGSKDTMSKIAEWARTHMNNLQYAIYNRRIAGPGMGSKWRSYSGVNPHTDHVHLDFMTGGGGGGKTGSVKGVQGWIPYIKKAAAQMKVKINDYDIQGILAQIKRESTGNEKITQSSAVRDINTRNGNPARGLLQYIPQTFRAYAMKGHSNIYSGYDQLLAWFNNSNWRKDNPRGRSGWGPSGKRRYKNGTGLLGHLGGDAIMGDGNKREPFLLPNGLMGLSPAISTLFKDLPKGTVVWKSVEGFMGQLNNGASSILGSNMPSVDLSGISSAGVGSTTTNNYTLKDIQNALTVDVNVQMGDVIMDGRKVAQVTSPYIKKELINDINKDSYKRGMKR